MRQWRTERTAAGRIFLKSRRPPALSLISPDQITYNYTAFIADPAGNAKTFHRKPVHPWEFLCVNGVPGPPLPHPDTRPQEY